MSSGPLNIVLSLTVEGAVVRLEPVRREHAPQFWEVAKNDLDDIFRWIPYSMTTLEDFQKLIDKAFDEQERGESVVFATVERKSGRALGSTRFMNIDRVNRRVEIGSTWIAPAWQHCVSVWMVRWRMPNCADTWRRMSRSKASMRGTSRSPIRA